MNFSLPRPRLRAFTLIELLTVIAIIGILAAIIIPTVGKVRDSANAASCVSNLRQISLAIGLYTNERGHYPPSISGGTTGPTATPSDGPSGRIWPQNLRPYMGAVNIVNNGQSQMNSKLLLCPGRGIKLETSDIVSSYSANPNVMPAMDGAANSGNRLHRPSEFMQPAQLILMGDSVQRSMDEASDVNKGAAFTNLWGITNIYTAPASSADIPIPTPDVKDGDGVASFMYRHSSGAGANVVYLDGHVRNLRKGDILYRNLRNY